MDYTDMMKEAIKNSQELLKLVKLIDKKIDLILEIQGT